MSKKRKIIITMLLLIAAACAAYLAVHFIFQGMNKSFYEKLQGEAYTKSVTPVPESSTAESTPAVTETPAATPTETPSETSAPAETPAESASSASPIDFAGLQAQYPDIYAWIRIDGTTVDYPILQSSTNNSYYLNHNVDGSEGHPGAIFSENFNTRDFTDYNNVLYGHNLTYEGGTMFTMLHQYMDMDFMKEHSYIQIFLPDKTLIYEVFSAVTYDDRDIMTNFDFTTPEGRQTYLDSLQAARTMDSPWRDDVTVDTDSRLLTLSTCIDGYPSNRRVVSAVLTNPEDL